MTDNPSKLGNYMTADNDRCGSGCGVAGDNRVPGGVDGDGVGSPSAEITVCAPALVSMAITCCRAVGHVDGLDTDVHRQTARHFPTGIVVAAWVPGSIMHGVVVGAA